MAACCRPTGDTPAAARFCTACGAPLDAASSARRDKRKIITVLFADLVGFTSRSEQLDVWMPKTPPYSLEFRLEAVRLLRSSGRTIPEFARELGCSRSRCAIVAAGLMSMRARARA